MSEVHPTTPLGSPKPTVRVISDGKPAPELVAAMAESRKLREQLADLLGRFVPSAQAGWTARVSGTVLNRLYAMAGLPPADLKRRTASPLTPYEELDLAFADARDTTEAMEAQLATVTAERNEMRALIDAAQPNDTYLVPVRQLLDDRNRLRSLIAAVEGVINDDVLAYHERYARANQLLGRSIPTPGGERQ